VVLLLTAIDPGGPPSTVVSRCQVVRLAPVAPRLIADGLRDHFGCDAQQAEVLARLSGGRPGWAIEASNDPALLSERAQALESLTLTISRSFRDRLDLSERLASEFSRDQGKVLRTLMLWQLFWWDVQLMQRGCSDLVTNVDRSEELGRFARATGSSTVHAYVRRLDVAAQRLTQNVNPRLALEALLVTSPVIV
jgi:DNA polymerase-3 subunit delta'